MMRGREQKAMQERRPALPMRAKLPATVVTSSELEKMVEVEYMSQVFSTCNILASNEEKQNSTG